jgi:hypothetical protein
VNSLSAKAFQMRLQTVLSKVINANQRIFLPLRYIQDNVLVTHKTLTWAKQTKKDFVYTKSDFTKAYNIVAWKFMFSTMAAIGTHPNFVAMITLFI